MDMPAPPCPVDYHLEGAELMTCKLSDLEYGSSVVLQVPLACLMGVALEQCTGVTETCLRLRLRLRFGTSGVTERCLRLREGLRVLPLSLQTKEHSIILVRRLVKPGTTMWEFQWDLLTRLIDIEVSEPPQAVHVPVEANCAAYVHCGKRCATQCAACRRNLHVRCFAQWHLNQ